MSSLCENCNIKISSDLKYCPLCGKCVNNSVNTEMENGNSFPIVDQSYIYRAKWLKVIKEFSILIALICLAINLVFPTKPFWFPYVIAGIFVVYMTIFYPFGDDKNHISCLPATGLILSLFIAGIDIYIHFCLDKTFGWGCLWVVPFILSGFSVLSMILVFSSNKNDLALIKGLINYSIICVVYLVFKLIFFKGFATWPLFMATCIALISVVAIFIFKRKHIQKVINRNYHI